MKGKPTISLDSVSIERGEKPLLSRPASGSVHWALGETAVTAPDVISFLPSESYAKTGLRTREEAQFWNADLASSHIQQHGMTLTQNLSTGQTKRLSFAKLLSDEKPIWILDEPLAGLDSDGRALIATHLQNHVSQGGLALVASHAPITVDDIPNQRLVLK